MKYQCRLENITKSRTSGFRSHGNPAIGSCDILPTLGQSFLMTAPGLDNCDAVRIIQTTPIISLQDAGNTIEFNTQSGSVYKLTYYEEK